jgi:hypothetical protein
MTGTRLFALPDPEPKPQRIGRDKHKLRPQEPLTILFLDDDIELSWMDSEMRIARYMFRCGKKYDEVAKKLDRPEFECFLLGAWLVWRGEI